MLEFTENLGPLPEVVCGERLSLDYESRTKARRRVVTDSGREAGLFLERGRTLAEGDVLRATDGTLARVRCRPEPVRTARACDALPAARACFHLGNRHAAVQIGNLWVRFLPDPVLEDMVRGLGLELRSEEAPFVPEGGAYGHVAAPHAHSHAHAAAPHDLTLSHASPHDHAHSRAEQG
ncbi:MAG: urease accessory protein UreE [Desulfovibrio sp.]|jgi:urease accessory protein|nr:urease accessory protein UreE [Desulfovibrio sp.]